MPSISGIDVPRLIRERCAPCAPCARCVRCVRSLFVIVLRCVDDERMMVRALDVVADDFLVKLVNRELLRARLEAFSRRSRSERGRKRTHKTAYRKFLTNGSLRGRHI
ncbi:MAG: response regulator transcription factor [Bacteriovorax sp.]|nr:response regulator transcription factor [Rhizobacter sp.]